MKAFFLRLIRPIEWSLLTKLLVTFGLASLLPLVAIGSYNYDITRQTVLHAQIQYLTSYTNHLAAHLDTLLFERQANLRQLAEDAAVQAFSAAWPDVFPEIQAAAQEDLGNLSQLNPYFQAVYLMNREGDVILSSTDNAGLNFSIRPYFQEALAGKDYVSEISISVDLGKPVIYFSSPIRDNEGKVVAVAVLRVLAEEIWSLFDAEKDELGPGSVAILFDEYGIRLAHSSDRSLIFKAVVPLSPEVEAQLLAEGRFGDMPNIESTNLPELAEGLRQADSQPHFIHQLVIRDELFHAGAARLTVNPWTVIESVPARVCSKLRSAAE